MKKAVLLRFIKLWEKSLGSKSFSTSLMLTLTLLLILGIVVPYFFEYIQGREGIRINDFILERIPPKDMSLVIFPIIYLSLVITMSHLLFYPDDLLKALQAYYLLSLFRILTIYFFNLEPPVGIVDLNDPFVAKFFYSEKLINKDLFFSGHTATMVLLVLVCRDIYLKIWLLIATLIIAVLILVQHVHYTIDVLAAPGFAWMSYYITKRLL